MPAPGGRNFLQDYNCQAVVDSAHEVIVAARATNQASDKQQGVAMIEETISNTGTVPTVPKEVSDDAGYYSAKAVDGLQQLGVDPYVAYTLRLATVEPVFRQIEQSRGFQQFLLRSGESER